MTPTHNTLKGVPFYRRKDITFQQYLSCLSTGKSLKTDLARLQFTKQEMSLIKQTKIALSSFEDKRYYIDNFKSLGYGHPDCVEMGMDTDVEMPNSQSSNSQSVEGKFYFNLFLHV